MEKSVLFYKIRCERAEPLTGDLFQREILTVSELTDRLKDLLETAFSQVWISGEVSNLAVPRSGHYYLTLKDARAQIRAVMFRTQQRYLAFAPADGQEVLVRGRLSVYEPRGEYQILIEYMEPRGEGALRLAFERLKARLAEEGLFDEARKKRLPFLPGRVALVTSPTGAAVRDFIRVARERYENAVLSIYPVRVQGDGAAAEIAGAIEDLNRWGGFDVIVLTRGGGSLEDLWAFNEEVVARAVAASTIPVVSAVGHEIDFSIADFAADLRAPTPTAAAMLVFREKAALKDHLAGLVGRLGAAVRSRAVLGRERVAHGATRLGDPSRRLADRRLRLDDLSGSLTEAVVGRIEGRRRAMQAAEHRLAVASPLSRLALSRVRLLGARRALVQAGRTRAAQVRERLALLAARLSDLSPLAVLQRGFAVVRQPPEMRVVRSSRAVRLGERLNVLLFEGELNVVVDEVV